MTFSELAASYRRQALRSFVIALARRNLSPAAQREEIRKFLEQTKVAEADAAWFEAAGTKDA